MKSDPYTACITPLSGLATVAVLVSYSIFYIPEEYLQRGDWRGRGHRVVNTTDTTVRLDKHLLIQTNSYSIFEYLIIHNTSFLFLTVSTSIRSLYLPHFCLLTAEC